MKSLLKYEEEYGSPVVQSNNKCNNSESSIRSGQLSHRKMIELPPTTKSMTKVVNNNNKESHKNITA